MKFSKLRIAWSVLWGIACLLMIALWIWSYWRAELLRGRLVRDYEAISVQGRLKLSLLDYPWPLRLVEVHESFSADQRETKILFDHMQMYANSRGFGWNKGVRVLLPHWF